MNKQCNLGQQGGMSLLELSIAMALVAAVVLLDFRHKSAELKASHLNNESQWVVGVLDDIRQLLAISPNYAALSDAVLGSSRSIPAGYRTLDASGTVVTNAFGGRVHVAPLSLGAPYNAYALNYSGVTLDACVKLIVSLNAVALQKQLPLYAMVGDVGLTDRVPDTIGLNGDGSVSAAMAQTVLLPSPNAGLDMLKVSEFCKASSPGSPPLRSLTLVRRY